ncbi:MAG TPA: amino acid adenylation domain-containing protein, partial [Pseudonocardiaceae bacterium]
GRGDAVGVSLPKGPDQVTAVLGVLAAGGVYVPVGVDQPPARRDTILAAAAAVAVLTADVMDEARGAAPLAEPVAVDPDDLAYVIFTSGSTGVPKGVETTHRAALNTVDDITTRYGVGPYDRVLAVSALDFDLSVYDVFGLLGAGGTVVCVAEDERRDAHAWAELVRRHRVTVWNTVPALLDMLLVAATAEDLAHLRLALVSGDWVGLDLHPRLTAVRPRCRLVALGGATEAAIWSNAHEVTDVPPHWRSIPYGRPLRNQRYRVVDAEGHDRPDWVPGELWIGGVGVAEGYRGDPERTAEKFVRRDDGRWYRTGDLGRYWPDGTLEFLGRTDHQVKLRGHRVELGEIEATLGGHPHVAHAVAAVVDGRLAAALVTRDERAEVAAWLAERLPHHMVPERFVALDELPLTANGKVDRAAVTRLLADAAPAGAETHEPPRTPAERLVAEVWSEVLGRSLVGRDDDFFALGGDSVLATRAIARLRAAGAGVRLRQLFAAPRLADLAVLLDLGTAAEPAATTVVADPANRHRPFPPTDVQRAYWVGRDEGFALGGVATHYYNEFDGEGVDLERLRRAWDTLVARHEMLRAVFDEDTGDQRILPLDEVGPVVVPVVEAGEADAERALGELRAAMSHQVLDPARWPLFDVRAVRYVRDGAERTRLGLSLDNLVLDGLSTRILLTELAVLYDDPAAELPPVGVSFRDYVLAEPDREAVAAAEAHWRERLDALPPAPQLPLRVDPGAVVRPRFSRRTETLPADRWKRLTETARGHGLTQSAVLLTCFADVLSAWSARPDLTVNLTLFDRRDVHPDIHHVLGDFTSLLLLAHEPRPGEGFLDRARRLLGRLWADLEHRDVSAVWVLRELARRTGTGDTVMPVVFTSALGVAGEVSDHEPRDFPERVWGVSQTPQVWLDHQVYEERGALVLNWDAVDELFPDGVLDAMFAAYLERLHWLVDADWARVTPELTPPAHLAARAGVNATEGPLPGGLLHDGFFARAAAAPDATAVVWDGGTLSYGELAGRALRVAGALRDRGVVTGDLVGVSLPKGPDQLAAVLGVLAAGAGYVPVGVDQPPARRDTMLATAGARETLTAERVAEALVGKPLAAPVPVDPGALAYVIFTSGSTGVPKGVELTHRAALNTVDDLNGRYGVGPDDRVLAVSALDFDLSVYDVFGLLGAGGTVVCVDEDLRRDAHAWAELVRAHGVTVWNTVPALLDMLLVAATAEDLATLRLALVSGDWVGLDLHPRLREKQPSCRLVAMGGATEAAIWSNYHEVTEVPSHWRSIPYGRPLRNQRFRVVDVEGRDRPDWVTGELWIGGAGVAQGYRADPDTTAAKFVEHDGGRWYRTGDLGRYWPDGTLEFLGRTDHQVKLRGHRVELGEVEAALHAHPGVTHAVAAVAGDHLAAAVVTVTGGGGTDVTDVTGGTGDGTGDAAAELTRFVADRLPGHMVPARVLVLDALPLTANGKVDRAAVGRLLAEQGLDPEDDPPRGPVETELAGLWAEILELPAAPGRRQSFFALGGDSLAATRLVEAVRRRFAVRLPLRRLYAAPTVAGLAVELGEHVPAPLADLEDWAV